MEKRGKQDNGVGKNELGRFSPTHGLSHTKLHGIWAGMIMRCTNPKFPGYKYWGGKGVIVCDEWFYDFKAFYNWALANGWEKGLHIDRFPNQNGNYEPAATQNIFCISIPLHLSSHL